MKPFHSEKGQESAPFEVLIAVVIMTFVIVIGFQALDKLQDQTCKGLLNQNLELIKSSVESVVKNKSKENVTYSLPNCFKESESSLSIIDRDDTTYCSAVCGGSLSQCTVLQFSSPSYNEVKCLRISSATSFPTEGDTCDPAILEPADGYEVIDWKAEYNESEELVDAEGRPTKLFRGTIPPGTYTLVKQSNLFSQAPIICVFKRVN